MYVSPSKSSDEITAANTRSVDKHMLHFFSRPNSSVTSLIQSKVGNLLAMFCSSLVVFSVPPTTGTFREIESAGFLFFLEEWDLPRESEHPSLTYFCRTAAMLRSRFNIFFPTDVFVFSLMTSPRQIFGAKHRCPKARTCCK